MKTIRIELMSQLKVILPLAALLFLLLLIGTGRAESWFCIDIGGSTYCWDDGDYGE